MESDVLAFVSGAVSAFEIKEPIIDFGGNIEQIEYLAAIRSLFPGKDYRVFDLGGPDIIGDIYDTKLTDESVGTALCLETLEHLAEPQKAIDEIRRVLISGGLLIMSVPICWHIHQYPKDYWRLLPDGLAHLLRDWFKELNITRNSEGDAPGHCFVTARKI